MRILDGEAMKLTIAILGVALTAMLSACPQNPSVKQKGARGEEMKSGSKKAEDSYAKKRESMVRNQIERRGVRDEKVLAAMRKVPRHEFIPKRRRGQAYDDHPLSIGKGQTISQPYIVAYMTEALNLEGNEKVLEIGTGSGYQAAVLAEIVPHVYSIEIVCELEERASKDLERMGYDNVTTMCGDGYKGWPEHAPFDAVIVTAAPDQVPPPLLEQLKKGGRLIVPEGKYSQELRLYTKTEKGISGRRLLPVRFVPMTGEAEKPGP
jgi:protein-L-isoaspartate(D-aspartate) O-methyltransferase